MSAVGSAAKAGTAVTIAGVTTAAATDDQVIAAMMAAPLLASHPAEPVGWRPVGWGHPAGWDVPVYSAGMEGWPAVWPDERAYCGARWPALPDGLATAPELAAQGRRPRNALRPDAVQIGPATVDGEPVTVDWSGLDPENDSKWPDKVAQRLGLAGEAEVFYRVRYPAQALYRCDQAHPAGQPPTSAELRADRAHAARWASQVLADPATVVLATSHIGPFEPPIEHRPAEYQPAQHGTPAMIEVAACTVAGIPLLHTRVDPQWNKLPRALPRGITAARLRAAPTFTGIKDQLLATLSGRRLVCLDRAVDYGVLYREREYEVEGVSLPNGHLSEQASRPLSDARFECLRLAASWHAGRWDARQRPVLAAPIAGADPLNRVRAGLALLREMAAAPDRYRQLCERVRAAEAAGRDQRRRTDTRDQRVRLADTRAAVLERSGGWCENPDCTDTGYRGDRTDTGGPLLEVHHTDGDPADAHARGGRDNPAAALALCPNCHALVSRGRDRLALQDRLAAAAAAAHTGALDPAPPGSSR